MSESTSAGAKLAVSRAVEGRNCDTTELDIEPYDDKSMRPSIWVVVLGRIASIASVWPVIVNTESMTMLTWSLTKDEPISEALSSQAVKEASIAAAESTLITGNFIIVPVGSFYSDL